MPSKRQILEQLKRDDLLAILDEHELSDSDRRVRDDLVDIPSSRPRANRIP